MIKTSIALGDLAASEPGSMVDGPFGSNLKASEYQETGVPLIRLQNVRPGSFLMKDIKYISEAKAAKLRRHSFQPGDVVISKLGDPCGIACIVPKELGAGILMADIVRFRGDRERVDHRFVMHYLNSEAGQRQVRRETKGATRPRVNLTQLKGILIPGHGLAEQRRIAAILDRTDALIAKRQRAIDMLDELAQAVFLEMFAGPSDWNRESREVKLEDILATDKGAIRTGPFGSQLLHKEFTNAGIAVLGIDNAVNNEFQWGKSRFISPAKYEQLKRYTVSPGDVLITIMGTCGRAAVVPEDIPPAINTKHLCCITVNREWCLPEFLHAYFLLHPVARDYLHARAKGAIMAGLNMGIIKEMPMRLPPISLQKSYVARAKAIRQLKNRFNSGLVSHHEMKAATSQTLLGAG